MPPRRIYLNNYNFELLPQSLPSLEPYLVATETYTIIWSSEGIFKVRGTGGIEKMEPIDHPIRMYPDFYEGLTLIEDPSYFKIDEVHSIPVEYESCAVVKRMYSKGRSDVRFVVELGKDELPCDFYLEMDETNQDTLSASKGKVVELLSLLF